MSWDVGAWIVNVLKNIVTTGRVPVVKSIQRGTYTFTSTADAVIPISAVNSDKCRVEIQNGSIVSSAASGGVDSSRGLPINLIAANNTTYLSKLISISETELVISANYAPTLVANGNVSLLYGANIYGTVSWQVIEYY